LRYCHKNLVVHRDIKLENLLIDDEGVVKICDFGVSKQLDNKSALISGKSGTPAYMAPEVQLVQQYNGFTADVWSLGVCLFAMVCGAVPFKGKSVKELIAQINKGELEFPDNT
jgi:serine/threonine protein kinase